MLIDQILNGPAQLTDEFLKDHFRLRRQELPKRAHTLIDAMEYSLFSGGKRFRPALTILSAEALGVGASRSTAYAAALEMVHTYSLIHDDLPALDNDDTRRGKPTNHKVYGEALAIMAGDALLTEAWHTLTKNYASVPEVANQLGQILSEAASASGMIGGQVMDLDAQNILSKNSNVPLNADELGILHNLKTATLMRAATEGAAVLARANADTRSKMRNFGETLGICFQIADDIHDFNPKKPELTGLPKLIGVEKTRHLLEEQTSLALSALSNLGSGAEKLRSLVNFNLKRVN